MGKPLLSHLLRTGPCGAGPAPQGLADQGAPEVSTGLADAPWRIVKHVHPALLRAQAGLCLPFCKLERLLCFLYLHFSCACQTSCLSSLVNYWITFHPLICIIFLLYQEKKKNFAGTVLKAPGMHNKPSC